MIRTIAVPAYLLIFFAVAAYIGITHPIVALCAACLFVGVAIGCVAGFRIR